MTRYKIADLVIDIPLARGGGGCGVLYSDCAAHTLATACWHVTDWCQQFHTIDACKLLNTVCRPLTMDWCRLIRTTNWVLTCEGESLPPEDPWHIWDDPRELVVLKEQLQAVLVQVEKQQEKVVQKMQPQTLEEVQAIEAQLKAATSALAARRKELTK